MLSLALWDIFFFDLLYFADVHNFSYGSSEIMGIRVSIPTTWRESEGGGA